jgi:hypothetical protein
VVKESFVPSTQEEVRCDSWGFWLTQKRREPGLKSFSLVAKIGGA